MLSEGCVILDTGSIHGVKKKPQIWMLDSMGTSEWLGYQGLRHWLGGGGGNEAGCNVAYPQWCS